MPLLLTLLFATQTPVAEIDQFLQNAARLGQFSGQVLIARGDTVLLDAAYGLADRRTGRAIKPETLFDIGSIAKQFTGALFLQLEAEGRVRFEDSIARYLPEVPADKRAITLDMLLHHTAGIPRDPGVVHRLWQAPARDSMVAAILAMPLNHPPGTTFEYSNLGYVLLAAIAEQAGGEPFRNQVRRRLFRPAGLRNTGFQDDARTRTDAAVAHGYWNWYDAGSPRDRPDSWQGLGGSQVVSTAHDLWQWIQAVRNGKVLDSSRARRFLLPDTGAYGIGWNVVRSRSGGVGVLFHAGSHPDAFGSEVRYYPARNLIVALTSNLQLQDGMMSAEVIPIVADAFIRDSLPTVQKVHPAPASAQTLAGTYRTEGMGRYEVWRDASGEMWLSPIDSLALRSWYGRDTTGRRDSALINTRERLESLRRGTCPSGARWAGRPQVFESEWPERMCRWKAELGALQSTAIIGVKPLTWSKENRQEVYTELRFARGSRVVSWLWEGNALVESWTDPAVRRPQSIKLGWLGKGRFVTWDWFVDRTTEVSVQNGKIAIHPR